MTQEPENQKNENRWWEFYFVRYFVGTAIGAIVVLFLATANSPFFARQGEIANILKILKPEKFESIHMIVLATVGLAFCYIASAPVLVLHAVRGSLLKIRSSFDLKLTTYFIALSLLLAAAQITALWMALRTKGSPLDSWDFYSGTVFLLFLSVIFIGQLFLLWMAMSGREQNSFDYYDQLVQRRASAGAAGKEYVESYRHLREHGNAFFIVLLELFLGAVLFYSPVPWGIILMLWIFPAVLIWAFGTMLENRNF